MDKAAVEELDKKAAESTGKAGEAEDTGNPGVLATYGFDGDKLHIYLDLGKLPVAHARGTLLNMDDIVKQWYVERHKAKQQIIKPSFFQRTKDILTKRH